MLDDLTTPRPAHDVRARDARPHGRYPKNSSTATLRRWQSVGRKHLCQLSTLRWQQKDGLDTVLPYGACAASRRCAR